MASSGLKSKGAAKLDNSFEPSITDPAAIPVPSSAPSIEALRTGESLADAKLEALRQFTLALVKKYGQISEEEQGAFLAAGYEPKHALEVLVGIAQKTLSNFVNHLAQTPLDDFAKKYAWTPSVTSETQSAS